MGDIARPLPTPLTLPDPGDTTLDVEPSDEAFNWPGHDLNSHHRTGTDTCFRKCLIV
jgi:cryptochrome